VLEPSDRDEPESTEWPRWMCPDHGVELLDDRLSLVCARGHAFERVEGIPYFTPAQTYADAFGTQWNHFRRTQLDSYTGTTITRDRTRAAVGENVWNDLGGQLVLECGCGAGRFTEVLLDRGASVVSVDLSNAVLANQENCPQGPRHRIARADLGRLPFERQRFDGVFCLGVVQHTPDPEETIEKLYAQVKPGGWLVLDHYTYTFGWFLSLKPVTRQVLRRLPPETGLRATSMITDALLPLHRRARGIPRKLLNRVSPVVSYYTTYPELDDTLQREWALLDTHDSQTDRYKHFRTVGQLRSLFQALGLEQVHVAEGVNGVVARGQRPL